MTNKERKKKNCFMNGNDVHTKIKRLNERRKKKQFFLSFYQIQKYMDRDWTVRGYQF